MSSSFEIYLNELFRRSNPDHDIKLANSPILRSPVYNMPYLTPSPPSSPHLPPHFAPPHLSLPHTPLPYLPQNTNLCRPPLLEVPNISYQSTPDTPAVPTPLLTPVPVMSSTLNQTTSTPLTPGTTSTPPTPGTSSPPRFFFPPDFPASGTADQNTNTRSSPTNTHQLLTPPSTPANTPSSFGKAPKQKRRRTKFTSFQLDVLEREFDDCTYISTERRRSLAAVLGLTSENIRVWFQNRRTQIKKMKNNRPKQI
ncbi:hypothetical protein ACHWQZ_G006201 [Mnemiopsis leidyi]|uniref:ANTP class homeobox transcription factor ANTP03b n=1 Tax=Mnemiopsis leidyi TaxID=27923 RepID=E3UJX5_MNELE|nr:ANTP class homeobox transcription factor ANTP03b [Mnemiopsis leidyi]